MLWFGLFTAVEEGKTEHGWDRNAVGSWVLCEQCSVCTSSRVLNFGGIYFENTEAIQSLFELPVSVSNLETLIFGGSGKRDSTHKVVCLVE